MPLTSWLSCRVSFSDSYPPPFPSSRNELAWRWFAGKLTLIEGGEDCEELVCNTGALTEWWACVGCREETAEFRWSCSFAGRLLLDDRILTSSPGGGLWLRGDTWALPKTLASCPFRVTYDRSLCDSSRWLLVGEFNSRFRFRLLSQASDYSRELRWHTIPRKHSIITLPLGGSFWVLAWSRRKSLRWCFFPNLWTSKFTFATSTSQTCGINDSETTFTQGSVKGKTSDKTLCLCRESAPPRYRLFL